MAPIILYSLDVSPPVRAVISVIKALNLEFERKELNLLAGEQYEPEFLKINPQHTVPTIIDNGFTIWDSHAIVAYLVGKYGKDDSLYPKDLQKRAIVDQRMHFDSGILFPRLRRIFFSIVVEHKQTIPIEYVNNIIEAYQYLEAILTAAGTTWLAGNQVTVADLCVACSIGTINAIIPISQEKFPNIYDWFEKCNKIPYLEPLTASFAQIKSIVDKAE